MKLTTAQHDSSAAASLPYHDVVEAGRFIASSNLSVLIWVQLSPDPGSG
jgi:hypothetical protein